MSSTGPQRRGLVLSGGGFFGAFQAGACESLGPFGCIAGTSAGALNGWAIASGMPPAELQRLWLKAAATTRAGLHWPRYWGDGLLNTSILQGMVRNLVRDWRPRIDLAIVVSQGWNGQQVLIRNQDIDADALLASCAVPFLIPAKQLGGKLSFDGGLRDACPLWAARAMGAEEIVAVNVWTHLPKWWPGRSVRASRHQPGVTLIEPPRALGAIRHSALATTDQVTAWIEAGRQATSAVFAR